MAASTRDEARSLFVVSRDEGELGFAMCFLRGQVFASRAAIMLPNNLYPGNRDSLPAPAFPYGSPDDVLKLVDTHKPDLVFLLSAYLLSVDNLSSPESLDTLLRQLQDRGCRVMTSDPFLGLAPQLTLGEIDSRMLAPGHSVWNRRLVRFSLGLKSRRAKLLRLPSLEDVIHLYPTSIPHCDDRIARLSFFNPAMIRAALDSGVVGDERDDGQAHDPRPHWLFLLSEADLHVQLVLSDVREFIECLLGMLRHAIAADRHATLIAPPLIVDLLATALRGSVELLPSCPLAELEQRILAAEYVFSWDAFSFPELLRYANELPVFLFDRGHFARTSKRFYEIARACHFGGWEPTYLDQRQLFSPYVLAHLAKLQKPAMRALRERWQASPTPDELVDQLLL